MKKLFFTILIITFSLSALNADDSFDEKMIHQILDGKFDKTLKDIYKQEINRSSYGTRYLLKADIYILQGNYKKAKLYYLGYATLHNNTLQEIQNKRLISEHIEPFYKELSIHFPKKKKNLEKGLKIYNSILPLLKDWQEKAPNVNINKIYGAILMGISQKKAPKIVDNINLPDVNDAMINYEMCGIKSLSDYKMLIKIGRRDHYKIIKASHIKLNALIMSMSKTGMGFRSKKQFLSAYKALKNNRCKVLKEDFNNADEYNNKGKCYTFDAKMYQRLNRNHGLAVNISWGNYKPNLFYVVFDKSWKDGQVKSGIIKGLGNYQYETAYGSMNNVAKGSVINSVSTPNFS
jgi:tetratricopeptide (TPR) repeat protein